MRYFIKLSYNGSLFNGWQRQKGDVPSVQGELERALSIYFGEEMSVTGAGRTDTGVNAVGYIAHFDVPEGKTPPEPAQFIYKINAILHKGVNVHALTPVGDELHARFSAVSREYKYFLHRKKDPFMNEFSWWCKFPLDVQKMNEAAGLLLGTHDFSCFEKTGGNNLTSICTVFEAHWESWEPDHVRMLSWPCAEDDFLVFTIRADRFLRNMVRAVVGTLVDVGRGKHDSQWVEELLRSGCRSDAGESVPGNALFLSKIEYPASE